MGDRPTLATNSPYTNTATMGVPFEALIPYAICLGMFGVSGAALSKIRHMQNGGKGEALGGSVGQTDDGPRQATDGLPARADGQRQGARGLRAQQSLASREGRLVRRKSSLYYDPPPKYPNYYSERERDMYETQMSRRFIISAVLSKKEK